MQKLLSRRETLVSMSKGAAALSAWDVFGAGHAAQNIFLQAEALGMGAGIVGAFHDTEVIQAMKIPLSHEPLIIMPVGYKG